MVKIKYYSWLLVIFEAFLAITSIGIKYGVNTYLVNYLNLNQYTFGYIFVGLNLGIILICSSLAVLFIVIVNVLSRTQEK